MDSPTLETVWVDRGSEPKRSQALHATATRPRATSKARRLSASNTDGRFVTTWVTVTFEGGLRRSQKIAVNPQCDPGQRSHGIRAEGHIHPQIPQPSVDADTRTITRKRLAVKP
jgi:hypothetical protein